MLLIVVRGGEDCFHGNMLFIKGKLSPALTLYVGAQKLPSSFLQVTW